MLGLISAASSEVLPSCLGMKTVVPLQISPTTATLWGWGSWLVYAGSCCTTSEQLKIAASIAMATGAASLSYEGAAWMLELPWWIPGEGGRVATMGAPSVICGQEVECTVRGWRRPWWLLLGAGIPQPKFGLLLTPVLGQKGLFLANCERKLGCLWSCH